MEIEEKIEEEIAAIAATEVAESETEVAQPKRAEAKMANPLDFLEEPQTLTCAKNSEWVKEETLVIILRTDGKISSDFELCGKKMIEWVELATSFCKHKIIAQPSEEDFLQTVKREGEGFSYVAVFYSDTPMLEKSTFLEIMDHFSKNRMNVLKLKRGYVFRGEFLQNAKMILSTQVEDFGRDDFVAVDNAQSAALAFKMLNRRILGYHKSRGVMLFGENTIFVDADVEIEEGVVIHPNNILKGQTVIEKGVILESGNVIENSIVCENAVVGQSVLKNSKVGVGKKVGPFEKLVGREI